MHEELNKKLAEWAGFCDAHSGTSKAGISYWQPGKYPHKAPCPRFTESLDACFEYLVPKLYYIEIKSASNVPFVSVKISHENRDYYGKHEIPALAICLAIEKIIGPSV